MSARGSRSAESEAGRAIGRESLALATSRLWSSKRASPKPTQRGTIETGEPAACSLVTGLAMAILSEEITGKSAPSFFALGHCWSWRGSGRFRRGRRWGTRIIHKKAKPSFDFRNCAGAQKDTRGSGRSSVWRCSRRWEIVACCAGPVGTCLAIQQTPPASHDRFSGRRRRSSIATDEQSSRRMLQEKGSRK